MKYQIQNKTLRKVFKDAPNFSLTPRNANEELLAAEFVDRIGASANESARKVARKAIDTIGRKD